MVRLKYGCPCCGYETARRGDMRKHFNLLKPCPQQHPKFVVLTPEIKEHVLDNRRYYPPAITKQDVKIVNNNNYSLNLVSNMDFVDKFEKMMQSTEIKPLSLQDKIQKVFKRELNIFECDKAGYEIRKDSDYKNIVNKMCTTHEPDLSDANMIHNTKTNQVNMLHFESDDKWCTRSLAEGAEIFIDLLQGNFLNEYERYLLRDHKNTDNLRAKQDILELIVSYYHFIAAFDLQPYCYNREDHMIYDNGMYTHDCEELFYPKYKKAKEDVTRGQKKTWMSDVISIIKDKSKHTNEQMNKAVFELLNTKSSRIAL